MPSYHLGSRYHYPPFGSKYSSVGFGIGSVGMSARSIFGSVSVFGLVQ